ncbi:MmgE/PrpD family protein [Porphyrobacter sp. CACIAM 03H1]|uniref:MmgE/PrpD family protein n=1 Tax=Porphyrobacter sp. CACIAM 03H1 TaxID=2003315 RepID=UPI000B5AA091|nr:MmgE/PrpD family protein [Porphyrobacter sp. CACIAM 03H1]ASJ91001.1 MmgE/PrpD family protein [Porphyrobacter sp. CACIAM 03H1]
MTGPLLTGLGTRLARPVTKGERQRARLHLLDWLACVAGARGSEAGALGASIALAGWERATYLGNVLEMDDVHRTALLHPGPVVWPAALSMASARLEARLDAAVRGYEAMIAVGAAMDAHHYARWHPTATMGGFGAAAAFGSLIGFAPVEYAHALANAGSVAGGLWHMRHAPGVLTKQWHIYHAVRTGRDAALHIHYGATGPLELLEGAQGLFAAMAQSRGALAGDETGWLIHAVSFKPFAACRHAHPAIDAALELRRQGRLVAPYVVETYADALTFCNRPDPVTELDAKFSLQHAVAVVADGRNAEPEDFTPEAIAALAPLRAQVSVAEDPAITARYPAHFGARVNGLELVDTLGDPERPVGEEHIIAKMHSLARWGGLPSDEADRAVRLALENDDAAAIDAMLEAWIR